MMRRRTKSCYIYGLFGTVLSAAFICYLVLIRQVERDSITSSVSSLLPPSSAVKGLRSGFLVRQRINELEEQLEASRNLIDSVRQDLDTFSKNNNFPKRRQSSCRNEIVDTKSKVLSVDDIYESIPFENVQGGYWTQGWDIQLNDSRTKSPEKLRVFVVPHSHNDPGWLKTFDNYFKGQTKHILDNMLKFMSVNQDMKFIWAETSYLAYWWSTITPEEKEKAKDLLKNGQLEIVTGGWVMNDEANTEIFSMISQLVEGHEWLRKELNVTPRHGWAIDPFGLSPSMAYLLDKMDFDGMVVQRVHYEVKKYLAQKHLLEFQWMQSWQEGTKEDGILCHVTPFYSYDVPHSCGPDPKVCCQFDFRRLPPFKLSCPWKINPSPITNINIESRAKKLTEQYWKKAMLFRTNTILVPLGDDFRYEHPREWDYQYKNYKLLFDFINTNPEFNMEASFGTLADYFDHIRKKEPSFPRLSGDFFTYSDRDDHYWSGYYTSRPFYKRYDRLLSSYLRAIEILFSFGFLKKLEVTSTTDIRQKLDYVRQNLALFQHHDAITGTARDVVVNDYAGRMFKSLIYSQEIMSKVVKSFMTIKEDVYLRDKMNDPNSLPSIQLLPVDDGSRWSLIVFNSLTHSRVEVICFETSFNSSSVIVKNISGHKLPTQSSFLWDGPTITTDRVRHCFEAKLGPLSLSSFQVEPTDDESSFSHVSLINFDGYQVPNNDYVKKEESTLDISVDCQRLRLVVDGSNGRLKRILEVDEGISREVDLSFVYFGTKTGKTDVKSGAYIFMPDQQTPKEITFGRPLIRVTRGPIYSTIEVLYQQPVSLSHQLTIFRHSNVILVDNEFHIKKGSFLTNKELVMRLSSHVQNEDVFFTDLNGLQLIRRKRRDKIPVQANVYPAPTTVFIQDESQRMSILMGQPLGVTSPHPGTLDVFQDRRLLQDDQRGLGQGVTDNRLTRLSFKILFESLKAQDSVIPTSSLTSNQEVYQLNHPPFVLMTPSIPESSDIHFVRHDFPCDLHLLNLRTSWTRSPHQLFMILHRFGVSCDTACQDRMLLNVSDTFQETSFVNWIDRKMSRLSLSFMHVKDPDISIQEGIDVKPFEVDVYAFQPK